MRTAFNELVVGTVELLPQMGVHKLVRTRSVGTTTLSYANLVLRDLNLRRS
jgi:hypothetical protein